MSLALVLLRQGGRQAEAAEVLRLALEAEEEPLEPGQRALAAQALRELGG